jgi:hypothetical protein
MSLPLGAEPTAKRHNLIKILTDEEDQSLTIRRSSRLILPLKVTDGGFIRTSNGEEIKMNGLFRRRTTAIAAVAMACAAIAPTTVRAEQHAGQSSIVSANPVDTTPFVLDGRVEAVAKVGSRIIVGGTFTSVKNWQGSALPQTRNFLFAYSAITGKLDTAFVPVVNASVLALAPASDGTSVYVGGAFSQVNGIARTGLVKLDTATGATVAAFKGNVGGGGFVADLDVVGGKLYAVGTFGKCRSVARARLCAMSEATGTLDTDLNLPLTDYNPTVGAPQFMPEYHLDVAADGSKMMIVGNFSKIGGVTRTQIAQVDLTTSPDSVTGWSTSRYPFQGGLRTYVNGVDIDQTGTFLIVAAGCCPTYVNGEPIILGDHITRFEMNATGEVAPTWYTASFVDTFTTVAISGPVVYVGGHFRGVNQRTSGDTTGGVMRKGLAALDVDNGVPFNWNPGRDRGWGTLDSLLTSDQLIIGHDTRNVGGEFHPRLAAFPLAGGVTPPAVVTPVLPTQIWSLPDTAGATVTQETFNGTSFSGSINAGTTDFSIVRAAFSNGSSMYAAHTDGKLYKWSFDGTSWVSPVDVSARADYVSGPSVNFATVETMAHANKGLFLTFTNDSKLYWSGFNLESNLLSGRLSVVSGLVDGVSWADAVSTTVVGSTLYVTRGSGDLQAYPLVNNIPQINAVTTISGPGIDGRSWLGVDIFARN